MSELRLNVLTNEWVIIAPRRAARPSDFRDPPKRRQTPAHSPDCPFCPGNEEQSDERFRIVDPDGGGWLTRVVWNRFPALTPEAEAPVRRGTGWRVTIPAYGVHEVIVETPRHDLALARMPVGHVRQVLVTYRARYWALAEDSHLKQVVVFQNHGEGAGTSLVHPHSQILAMPLVSSQVRGRLSALAEHRARYGECLICQMLEEERAQGERIVEEGEHFVALIPYAALSPFHLWIFPKRRMASFGETGDEELADLAGVLRRVLRRLYFGLGDPDYNLVIRSIPSADPEAAPEEESFHWYIAIVPRLARAAGFELGSGVYINPSYPCECAAFLRAVDIESEDLWESEGIP
jgi:UDPglucose--hexose-1-phosphate uridylyltransferase